MKKFPKKKDNNGIHDYLIAIYIFILAIAISLAAFYICVQKATDSNSKKTLSTNVAKQCEHIYSVLDLHFQYLDAAATNIGKSGKLLSQENMDIIKSIQNSTDLEHVALIEPDGTAHYENGKNSDVSSRRYFKEGISGQKVLSDPLSSNVDQETRVVIGVPIKSGSSVIGILGGSYNVSSLSRTMINDTLGGAGYTLITTKEGSIIAYDGDSAYKSISYGDNFFDYIGGREMADNRTFNDIKDDFSQSHPGVFAMKDSDLAKPVRYLAYAPLGLNDWMICYVIPVSAAQKPYRFIGRYETILMVCIALYIVLLAAYIVHKNNKKTDELIRSAQIDALTGLYNKKTTETKINNILTSPDGPDKGALIIMDIDKFKSINDTYGHAIGDTVLKEFGNFIYGRFSDSGIVGRIGGDEFIVFINDITSFEFVLDKVRQFIEDVHQLKFSEFPDTITTSIGIAYFPDSGDCFMDLYKNADTALYHTKQNGRDGFSVFQ